MLTPYAHTHTHTHTHTQAVQELNLTCVVPEIVEVQKPVHYDREVLALFPPPPTPLLCLCRPPTSSPATCPAPSPTLPLLSPSSLLPSSCACYQGLIPPCGAFIHALPCTEPFVPYPPLASSSFLSAFLPSPFRSHSVCPIQHIA